MARIGTGINAGLGAINYTPYLQGAMAGSQAIGQGIAGLGQAAGAAIKNYYDKQEKEREKEKAASSFIATVKTNPQAFKGFFPEGKVDEKAIRDMVDTLGVGATIQLNAMLSQASAQEEAKKTKSDAAKFATQLQQGGGNLPSPYRKGAEMSMYTPESIQAGRGMYIAQQQASADLEKTLMEAQALRTPKAPNLTEEEDQYLGELAAFEEANKRKPTAIEAAQIRDRVVQSRRAQNTTNIGTKAGAEAIGTIAKGFEKDYSNLSKAAALRPDLEAMEAMLSSGYLSKGGKIISGFGANVELPVKAALNKVGLTNFEDVATTQRYLQGAFKRLAEAVQAFGSGTAISDNDLKTAKLIVGADLSVEPEAIREMFEAYKKEVAYRARMHSSEVKRRLPVQSDPELETAASLYRNAYSIDPQYYDWFSTPVGWKNIRAEDPSAPIPSGDYEYDPVTGQLIPRAKKGR